VLDRQSFQEAFQTNIALPPSELLYRISGSNDPSEFMDSCYFMVWQMLKDLEAADVRLQDKARILDFGCGVGKVIIGLHIFNPTFCLHGTDLESNLIEWCSTNLRFAQFYQNSLRPPLRWSDNTFDLINAVSVFTHLSLESQFRWAWELFRILAPGAHLHATFHGPAYFSLFSHVASTRRITRLETHLLGRNALIMELEQPISEQQYQSKTGEESQGQLEIAVAHTPGAVDAIFAPYLRRHLSEEGPIGRGHDAYIFQKPISSSPVIFGPFETVRDISRELEQIEFAFDVNGQNTFRVYVAAKDPGVYLTSLSTSVIAKLNGETFRSAVFRLSRGEAYFFGNHQYSLIELRLPDNANGSLQLIFTPKLDMQSPYLTHLRWIAPHVYTCAGGGS